MCIRDRVHSQDMGLLADALEAGFWTARDVRAADLPAARGYVLSPSALEKNGRR